MLATGLTAKLLVVAALVGVTRGYSYYRDQIPNGPLVPNPCPRGGRWPGVGHRSPAGGGVNNPFGVHFLRDGSRWSEGLCREDSDGDGLTNGQELGDPDCKWAPGATPDRTDAISHPGVCEPYGDPACKTTNSWLDCGLNATECPTPKDQDLRNITLRFPATPVPTNETNLLCMTFDLPKEEEFHAVTVEIVIDNKEALHHVMMFSCEDEASEVDLPTPTECGMTFSSGCRSIIAGWTIGSGATCLPENVGIRFGKGHFTRVLLKMHWTNPQRRSDWTDTSGMTLFYTPHLRPYSAAMLSVGQERLVIPPRQARVSISGGCHARCSRQKFVQPFYVSRVVSHMHLTGTGQKLEVFRDGVPIAVLLDEENFDYNLPSQAELDPPVEVHPGDEIRITCIYNSMSRTRTTYRGKGTQDEMCIAFLETFPAEATPYAYCGSYGERSSCDMTMEELERLVLSEDRDQDNSSASGGNAGTDVDGLLGGCDWRKFTDVTSAGFTTLYERLSEKCQAFGSCTESCRQATSLVESHACLQGEGWRKVRSEFIRTHKGVMTLGYLTSCPVVRCGACPSCED